MPAYSIRNFNGSERSRLVESGLACMKFALSLMMCFILSRTFELPKVGGLCIMVPGRPGAFMPAGKPPMGPRGICPIWPIELKF